MSKKPIPKPDLEAVFEHYGARLVGGDRGGWRKAECPLTAHEDRNPSASVNLDECRWTRFSCSKGGDAIDLIMENESELGFAGAVRLAESFLAGGDDAVRAGGGQSGLLPGASRRKSSGGNWTPSWKSL